MTKPNSQANELSLDQLDGINGGTFEQLGLRWGFGEPVSSAQAEGGMTTTIGTKRKNDTLVGRNRN